MKGRSLLKRLLILLNVLVSLMLFLSFLAAYIDPNSFLLPAYFGLGFPHLVIANTLFILFWLIARPRYSIISLWIVLLSLTRIEHHLQWSTPVKVDSDIDILSYNVRLFDLYNWSNNKTTRNEMLGFIKQTDSDVLCLQEFFKSNDKHYFNTLDTLLEVQAATNVHEAYSAILHKGLNQFGIATLSEFAIKERGEVMLDGAGHNLAIFTDVQQGGKTFRVYNLHLASIKISGLEKDIESHLETNDQVKQWKDVQTLWQRLEQGFKTRAKQTNAIRAHIDASPYPVIVCGDFNDTPGSYAYHVIKGNLQDAFVQMGHGIGSSYLGLFPGLRIDFILVDQQFEVLEFVTHNVKHSDHRPLSAKLAWRTED